MRLRIDCAYDGAEFSGWATQPGRRTVQGTLEAALATALRVPDGAGDRGRPHRRRRARARPGGARRRRSRGGRRLRGPLDRAAAAGPRPARGRDPAARPARTTGGRGARGVRRPLLRGLAALRLPHRRRPGAGRPARARPRADLGAPARPRRDERGVRAAGRACTTSPPSASGGRGRPPSARCSTSTGGATSRLVVGSVRADAFCHNMVRALVGCLLAVGEGGQPAGWPAEVMAGRRRDQGVTRGARPRPHAGGGRLPRRRRARRPGRARPSPTRGDR